MFRKLYKEANNEIKPDKDLLYKTLSQLDTQKKKHSFSSVYKYGFAAAAVVIITCSVYVYPIIKNINTIDDQVITTTEKAKANHEKVKSNVNDNEKYVNNENQTDTQLNNENRNNNIEIKSDNKNDISTETEIPHEAVTNNEEHETIININENVINIFDAYGLNTQLRTVSVRWDINQYYEYLGTEKTFEFDIPKDLQKTGSEYNYFLLDENEMPENDRWTFVYENENRKIMITTSKKSDLIDSVFKNNEYKVSKINGIDCIIGYVDNEYNSYITCDGISYDVTAKNISEDELINLLKSITN